MNIIQKFANSLYSPETIAKFRFQKIGKSILYVFFLMFIVSIPMAVTIGSNISSLFTSVENHMVDTFPDFTIENGVLQSDVDEPMIIEDGGTTVIFDPTGEFRLEDASEYDTAFALLEREAALITDGQAQTFGYQEFGVNISKEQLNDLVNTIGNILPLLISIVILLTYLFNTGLKFIGIFVLSFITLLLKRKTADQLAYRQGWVLSAYAVTLPTVLFAVIDIFGVNVPFSLAIYWVIAIVMMNLVLRSIPRPKEDISSENT